MTKSEFMTAPASELNQRKIADSDDILDKYRQHFAFKLADGYTEEEIAAMAESIRECAACGAAAVVVGALDSAGDIDLAACRLLVREAGSLGLGLTFHRAFDCCRDPFLALEQIIELGFDRILTSGQQPSAMEGAPLIRKLIQKAGGRIAIMPGAGVTPSNIDTLHELTGAVEFHGTRLCATRL